MRPWEVPFLLRIQSIRPFLAHVQDLPPPTTFRTPHRTRVHTFYGCTSRERGPVRVARVATRADSRVLRSTPLSSVQAAVRALLDTHTHTHMHRPRRHRQETRVSPAAPHGIHTRHVATPQPASRYSPSSVGPGEGGLCTYPSCQRCARWDRLPRVLLALWTGRRAAAHSPHAQYALAPNPLLATRNARLRNATEKKDRANCGGGLYPYGQLHAPPPEGQDVCAPVCHRPCSMPRGRAPSGRPPPPPFTC